jgi:hypothetical protein
MNNIDTIYNATQSQFLPQNINSSSQSDHPASNPSPIIAANANANATTSSHLPSSDRESACIAICSNVSSIFDRKLLQLIPLHPRPTLATRHAPSSCSFCICLRYVRILSLIDQILSRSDHPASESSFVARPSCDCE